jgi:uncharacterized heparinase superfamily protein
VKKAITQLNKLRGRGFRELMTRGHQELSKLADRVFLVRADEMSDEALYLEFAPVWRNGSGEGTAALLQDRLREGHNLFLPPLGGRRAVVETMNRRFQPERAAILAAAENAIEGRFDLLGYTNLEFGAPLDWHLNPLTGDRAPLVHWSRLDPVAPIGQGDLKVFWELHRHSHFVTLGQAFWLSNDPRFAEAFVKQATSWMDANPAGVGVGWAASLDVAFRAISWLWALHLCADSNQVSADFVARLVKSLIEHGRHIEKYLSTYFSPNTHLTGEALGLFYLGVALPELRRADHWRKTGLRILLDQLPKQVRPDGVYFEQTSYYHRYTTDFYLHLFMLIRAKDMSLSREDERLLWNRLEAMFDHLMWIERPDGTTPLYGDDDGGRLLKFAPRPANDFRDTLAMGATIFKRGDWKHAVGPAPVEVVWLLGTEGLDCYDRLPAAPPEEGSRAFTRSGYYVMRDGWAHDSAYVLIDGGRHGSEMGPGHAHADALAIEFAACGVAWLVDPATYVYSADPYARNWFRSTEAHNTATVDEEGQSVPAAPFAWQSMASCQTSEFEDLGDTVAFEGSHDGYCRLADPVTHTRSVVLIRKPDAPCLIINDSFQANAAHRYAIRYHFAPGVRAIASDNRIEAIAPTGEELVLLVLGSEVQARLEDGWVSTCYGACTPALIAVFEAECEGTAEFTSVVMATSG